MVRTGYDNVVAQRTTDLFAVVAKQAGKVRSVSPYGIVVDYADGTAQGYQLGRRFGNAAGLTIAHEVITDLREGDSFAEGEAVCYNTGFFERDFFDPKKIVLKNSLTVKTALLESTDTLEDACALHNKLSEKLSTRITKVKTIVVRFDQAVSELVKVGEEVTAESVLCLIEDGITANNKLFDESSIKTLKAVSAQSPRAKVKGRVERVEVFYHGDKQDMSESILQLCQEGDKELKKRAQATNSVYYSGQVDGGFRVESDPLPVDSVAIRIYITSEVPHNTGDKAVFCNQMKTVTSRIYNNEITSESGEVIDALFGCRSLDDRIVNSPFLIGTTSTLLKVIASKAVNIYHGRDKA